MVRCRLPLDGWAVGLGLLILWTEGARSQEPTVIPAGDGLGTQVIQTGDRYEIQGGTRSPDGTNLFHGFDRFDLSREAIANFVATPELRHILGRIGGDASYIDGLIEVTGGQPDLFLMNPAGIVFGPNVRLNVPADFTATSATALGFGPGDALGWFEATSGWQPQNGIPTAFRFGPAPGAIVNYGALGVVPGANLTLLGGAVLSAGPLAAPGGALTIATAHEGQTLRLSQPGMILSLEVPAAAMTAPGFTLEQLPALLTGPLDSTHVSAAASTAEASTLHAQSHLDLGATALTAGEIVLGQTAAGRVAVQAQGNLRLADAAVTAERSLSLGATGKIEITGDVMITQGGPVILQAIGDIETGSITSNGGDIFLSTREGAINTTAGVLDSTTNNKNHKLQDVVLLAEGDIKTGNINLNGDYLSVISRNGSINTTSGDIKANLATRVNLMALNNIETRSITTEGGNVRLTAGGMTAILGEIDSSSPPLETDGGLFGETVTYKNRGGNIKIDGFLGVDVKNMITSGGGSISIQSANKIDTSDAIINSVLDDQIGGNIYIFSNPDFINSALTSLTSNNQNNNSFDVSSDDKFATPVDIRIGDIKTGQGIIRIANLNGNVDARYGIIDTRLPVRAGLVGTETKIQSVFGGVDIYANGNIYTNDIQTNGQSIFLNVPDGFTIATNSTEESLIQIIGPILLPSPGYPPLSPPEALSTLSLKTSVIAEPDPTPTSLHSGYSLLQWENCAAPEPSDRETIQGTDAVECYEQHLALAQSLDDPAQAAIALHNLGVIRYRQGRYADARALHTQQWEAAQRLGDRRSQAQALSGIAAARGAIGQYADAIATYESALALAQAAQDPTLETHILTNLGTLNLAQKRYDSAQAYHHQALAIAQQQQDSRATAQNQVALAQIDFFQTRYDSAQTRLRRVLDGLETTQGDAPETVESATTAAIALRAWENWGMVAYAQTQWPEAIAAHERALALAQRLGDRHAEARALSNLGDASAQAGDRDRAVTLLEQAIARWTELREQLDSTQTLTQAADLTTLDADQIALFETQETTYSTLQQVLVDQGNVGRALEVAEQSRAQALRRLLVRNQLSSQDLPPEPSQTLADFQAIARTQQATLVFYSIMDQVTDSGGIRERNPETLQIWVINPQGELNFRQIPISTNPQQLITTFQLFVLGGRGATDDLPQDQAPAQSWPTVQPGDRVQLVDDAPGSGAWTVVSRDPITQTMTLQHPALPAGMTIERPAQDVVEHLKAQRDLNPFLRQLYDLAIAPIADLLPSTNGDRLILMPHQSLFWFPFAALQSPEGDYLIEDYAISLTPSLATLALAQDRAATLAQHNQQWRDRPLIVGNPTMPALPGSLTPLEPLPHADREARQIAQLLQAQPLLGAQATKSALFEQWQSAGLIHLATHGYLDSEQGLESAIALTPTPTDSGWLLAKDLIAATGRDRLLNAHLAVLSACNTGRGRLTADGVVGLSRSFLAAGVPSVVVSQWSIPDAPTADLMIAFYEALLNPAIAHQRGSQAIALRQAMLQQLQHFPNPRDWAGLILIGHAD